jgi:hypothetical protein
MHRDVPSPRVSKTRQCGLTVKVTCVASRGAGKGASLFLDFDICMLTVRIDLGLVNGSREFPKDLIEVTRVSMMRNSVPQKLVLNSD